MSSSMHVWGREVRLERTVVVVVEIERRFAKLKSVSKQRRTGEKS